MKNYNLIERLWTDSHEKQSPQRFARYAVMLLMLLTLGVGQMWADDRGFYEVYMVYDKNGTEYNYTYNGSNGSMDLGTITSSFKIKKMYLKVWDTWGDQAFEAGSSGLGYKTQSGSDTDYKANNRTSKSGNNYELQHTNMNLTIASNTNPSGNYTFTHWWFADGTWTDTYYLKNSSSNCAFTYKILPPTVKSSSLAISATNTAPGSGTGLSSGSPIILISGMASQLTITATQNHTDANSALWCKFGDNSYSSTTTYNIASGTTTSNQTIALKVKYRNNSASLDGAETNTTIYYKWAAPAPAIVLTSVTPSTSIVAGNDITLVGTRANSSNTISFQYTTNDGGTWTDITPKTSSLSSNVLTATWTVPDAHGATQTFKFRAKLAEASPIYSSKSDGVTVYNTKTIHVKNSNNWGSMYVYAWDGSGDITSSWHGNTGNTKTGGFSCTNTGGQWWDVVITSRATGFILNGGVDGDANKTNDLAYSTYTHDRCLAIGTGSGKKELSNSAVSCPSAPSVTTAAATSIGTTSVQFNASSVSANNDAITAYGFKWGTTSACDGGTVTASNLSSTTFSATKSSLTNGTTYYFKAYATNGQGTTYGDPVSVRTKFITTVTLNPQGGEGGTTEVTATEGSSMPTGKVAPTKWGYDFGGYYASAGGSGTKYYNANMSSAHNWDVAASTATIHAYWTAKSCTITLNNQGADSGKEGTTSVSTTYNTNTNLTSDITCPTRTGWKFQGYWSNTNGNGVQVIAADGSWISTVSGYMYEGKWVADGSATLYAYWVKASTYTFRYGTSGSEDWNGTAFTQVDATTTWQIENFTIPNEPNFYVGYEGLFYESGLGTGATKSKSVTRAWTDAPTAVSETYQGQMVLLPAGPTAGAIGQATGATGTLKIYSDSKHHNLYVGFEPSGYGVTRASGTLPFVNSSGTWRETNVVTLNSSDASGNFQVKLKTSSSYVATAHGTAENASAVNGRKITGDADIANGKKGVFQMWTDATSNNFGLRFVTVHDVTFNMQGHGSAISKYTDVRYNSKIGAPSAPSQTGYTFGGWYKEEGCTNAWNFASDVVTAATTLYAKWTPKTYTVTLDQQSGATGYGANGDGSLTATFDAAFSSATMPTAANGYAFMGYWSAAGGTGTQFTDASGNLLANIDSYSDASGHWIYDGNDLTLYAYYKKAEITALTLDATVVATNGTVGLTPTVSPTPVGDTKLCFYVFHNNDNPLDPQPEITWNGTKATFNAGETSGTYKIGVSLRTGTSCGGGTLLDSTTISYQVAGTHSVTVRYKCGDEVIKAASSLEGIRPLDWSDEITAPDIIGYSFTGWSAGDGVSLTDDNGTTTKTSTTEADIKIKAIYDGYLTANYSKKRVIYFNNTLNWENVYVYFYSGSYWNNDNGTGSNTGGSYTGINGQMQPISEGSKIYYFDAEAAGVNASYTYVSFTELHQNNTEFFEKTGTTKNKVIYRSDYKSTTLPMFVPVANQTPESKHSNQADYYNKGYWMNYPENTGYTLRIYDTPLANNATGASREFLIPFSEDVKMPLKQEVEVNFSGESWFIIYRNDGTYLEGSHTFKQTDHGDKKITSTADASKAKKMRLISDGSGIYTFTLTFRGDGGENYDYYLNVDFPAAVGDYRIVYSDNATWSNGAHSAGWYHPSDIIGKNTSETEAKEDTVSFFISHGSSPSMKFQRISAISESAGSYGKITWEDVPSGSITIPTSITASGVYNFIVTQPAGGASISLVKAEPYTGNYYIRTDCAGETKWNNFRSPDHLITYSEYSITHGGYSHYYAHWVQTDDKKNIQFCIANDYSSAISDTLIRENNSDPAWTNINNYIDEKGNILRNANVRFMWNQSTNKVSRSYVDGAQGPGSNNFLYILNTDSPNKIRWSAESALTSNKVTFADNGNWIYEANIQAQPNAKIRLLSNWGETNTITQYFKGSSSTTEDLVGGSGTTWYDIRVIYDFKTNRLVASYIPRGEIDDQIAINADVMFIREHQGQIDQLTFKEKDEKMGAISAIKTAYGVLRLNKWTLNNKEKTGTHEPLASPKSRYERDLFYISFPFRVAMEEVFGFGTYGTHWIIEEYDGASRAANGYWQESGPNWKFVFNRKNKFFEPYQGYVIALDLDELGESSSVWANTNQVELYFPSYGTMPDITNASVNCTIPEHLCTINRSEELGGNGTPLGSAYDRRVKDSHWNVISVPTYVNTSNITFANTDWITTADDTHVGPNFLYEWNPDDNSVTARSGVGYTYAAMHAYLVQYCGVITWSSSVSPAAAPRRNPEYRGEYEFRLEMLQNGEAVDQTFVKLSDNEAVTTGFEFNYDLSKEFNNSKSNIYTLIGTEQVAGNVLPLTEQTTIVPVGVIAKTNGDYTFSMPDGTEGIGITLVDTETGIRTILSALDYTVNLAAGTYDNRFFLEISPIVQTPTDVEEVTGDGLQVTGARKVIIDQKMFIIKDGKIYDAQGRQVK